MTKSEKLNNVIVMGPPTGQKKDGSMTKTITPPTLKAQRDSSRKTSEQDSASGRAKKDLMGLPMELTDTQELIDMLGYMRPSREQKDPAYKAFLDMYIEPMWGPHDGAYNYVLIVPSAELNADGTRAALTEDNIPRVAYMAHHDTVHRNVGYQSKRLKYFLENDQTNGSGNQNCILCVTNPKPPTIAFQEEVTSWDKVARKMKGTGEFVTKTKTDWSKMDRKDYSDCLGADCTTGIWIMMEMIRNNVAGVYVVHNDEEIGCVGAQHLVDTYDEAILDADIVDLNNSSEETETAFLTKTFDERRELCPSAFWIGEVDIAISFDRFGTNSIITHQSSTRTCSDDFASDLSDLLSEDMINGGYSQFLADTKGSYTDSNKYKRHISECTNFSVGYLHQHREEETQDLTYIWYLSRAFIKHGQKINHAGTVGNYRDETITPEPTNWAYADNGYSYGQTWAKENPNKFKSTNPNSNYYDDNFAKRIDNSIADKTSDEWTESERQWAIAWGYDPETMTKGEAEALVYEEGSDLFGDYEPDVDEIHDQILGVMETAMTGEEHNRYMDLCEVMEQYPNLISALIITLNGDKRLLKSYQDIVDAKMSKQ